MGWSLGLGGRLDFYSVLTAARGQGNMRFKLLRGREDAGAAAAAAVDGVVRLRNLWTIH